MDKVIKNKRGLVLVTVTLQVTKEVHKNFFISYTLSDQVWWCNIKWFFWVITKITSANLSKPIHDIINYSTSICPFESGKCGKEGEKLQNFEYLKNKKSFLDEMKNSFHSSWRDNIWWKNKNFIKNSRHKV